MNKPLLLLKSRKPIYLSLGFSNEYFALTSCTEKYSHIGLSTISEGFYAETLLHELNEIAICRAIIKMQQNTAFFIETENVSHFLNCISLNQYYPLIHKYCNPFNTYIDSDRFAYIPNLRCVK